MYATVGFLWNSTKWASIHCHLSLVHRLSFLGPLLVGTNHCIPGTPTKPAVLEIL